MSPIEARGLTKRFSRVTAVDGVTFSVRPGEVTGFLGRNGAGKTTTLRMILGLERPTSGTVTVDGRPYAHLVAPLRHVGSLLDARAVQPGCPATEHLLALARSNGIERRRVGEVLETVGLGEVARKSARTFSLGMLQRLGLAAALLGDPPILVFDEPLNGLDPEGIIWFRGLTRQMAAEGRTILVSSHLMTEMAVTAAPSP
jgi:ABC-2 type transport system ATP-binding protein